MIVLKGVLHEIFSFRLFLWIWISSPNARQETIGAILNFYENLQRYSFVNFEHSERQVQLQVTCRRVSRWTGLTR